MATQLEVILNGAPLDGATVCVGEIGAQEYTTSLRGIVNLTPVIPAGYVGFLEVSITKGSLYATAKVTVKYDEVTTIDLGEREEP